MMKKINTGFDGLYIIEGNIIRDKRGIFLKTFNTTLFSSLKLAINFVERYYSVSHKDVIRGMHFQLPPHDHIKLVNVLRGSIVDVVVDLRTNSVTYGQFFSIILNDFDGRFLYIPQGFAHGFKSLSRNSIVEYFQTTVYVQESDSGILWNSFGFDWQIDAPIISERDQSFVGLKDFNSPF